MAGKQKMVELGSIRGDYNAVSEYIHYRNVYIHLRRCNHQFTETGAAVVTSNFQI